MMSANPLTRSPTIWSLSAANSLADMPRSICFFEAFLIKNRGYSLKQEVPRREFVVPIGVGVLKSRRQIFEEFVTQICC